METKKYDLGDFEVDDFDYGDPFQDPSETSNDRSPVENVARGAYTGVKETLTDPSFHTNVLRKALPGGYGAAMDVASDVTDKGIGLYNQVTQDLRPAIVDLKKIGRRANGMVKNFLPDTLTAKIDDILAEDEQQNAELSQEQIRDQSIAGQLGDIFKAQAEVKQEDKTEDLMMKVVESKRHETMRELTQDIRNQLLRRNEAEDQVTSKWQRKLLEVQFRNFFVAKDHYELFKVTQEETLSHFRAISKNTGLPEAVKVRDSELAMQLTKERLIGKAQDKFAPMARDFLNKFTENVSKRVSEKVEEFKDAVATASFSGDMLEGIDFDELGISRAEMAGQMGAETLTRKLGEMLGKKIAPHLDKNKKVKTLSNKLMYGSENYHKIIKEALEQYESTNPVLNLFQESALDALRLRRESKVGYDEIANSTEQAEFDNITRKSIIEVIPGWLAKIWKSISGAKEDVTFDHATNEYKTVRQVSNDIEQLGIEDRELDNLREINKRLVGNVTDDTVDDLQEKIEEMFLRFAREDIIFDPEKFVKGDFQDRTNLSMDEYNRLADSIHSKLEMTLDNKLGDENVVGTAGLVEANRDLRRLRESMPNPYEVANIYANTANRDALRQTDMVETRNGEDHIRDEYLYERYRKKAEDAKYDAPMQGPEAPYRPMGPTPAPTMEQQDLSPLTNSIEELISELRNKGEFPTQQPLSFSTDIDYDRFGAMFEKNSLKNEVQEQISLLSEIREILIDLPDQMPVGGGGGQNSIDAIRSGVKRRYGKARDAVKKGFGNVVSNPYNYIKDKAKGLKDSIKDKFTGFMDMPKALYEKGKEKLGSAVDWVRGLKNQDVFLKGKFDVPAIKKSLLEAGEYLDAKTGKVITKLSDITGPIKDKAGDWVVDAEQWADGLFGKDGKKIDFKSIFKSVKDSVGSTIKWMKPGRLFGLLDAADGVRNFMGALGDVYYKDENIPRLKKIGLKRGWYTNESGKTVKALKDINSNIYKGKTMVISEDEIPDLVDVDRKPIRSRGGKLLDSAKNAVGKGLGFLKNVAGGAASLFKKGAGKVGDAISSSMGWLAERLPNLGSGGVSIGGGGIQKRIYSLLLRYFKHRGLDVSEEEKQAVNGPGLFAGAKTLFDKGRSKVSKMFSKDSQDQARNKLNELKEKGLDRASGLKDRARDKYEDLKGKAKERYDETEGLRNKARGKYESAKESLNEKKQSFGDKFESKLDTLFSRFRKFRDREEDEEAKERPGFREKIMNKKQALQDRAGSFINLMKGKDKDKEGVKDAKPQAKESKEKKGFFSKMLGLVGGAVSLLGSVVSGVTSLGTVLAGALGGKTLLDGFLDMIGLGGNDKSPKGKKPGFWGKMARGAVSLGAKGVGLAATGAVGVASALPAIASGIATVATGALAVATSPIVLTGAAVIGVGYLTHKWVSENMDYMTELRMAQYGVWDLEYEQCEIIGRFEKLLQPFVKISGERAELDGRIPGESIPELFGFDPKDSRAIKSFNHWFERRFKPVFLRHRLLLKKMGGSDDLEKTEQAIPDNEKFKFAKATMIKTEPSPYMVSNSPFGEEVERMDYGLDKINHQIAEIRDEYGTGKKVGSGTGQAVSQARRRAGRMNSGKTTSAAIADKAKDGKPLDVNNRYTQGAAAAAGTAPRNYVSFNQAVQEVANDQPARIDSTVNLSNTKQNPNYLMVNQPDSKVTDSLVKKLTEKDTSSIYTPTRMTVGEIAKMIASVAMLAEVDLETLLELAKTASDFNPAKRLGARYGLFLMDAATFRRTMDRHAAEYGIERPDSRDSVHQTIAMAELIKNNEGALTEALGRTPKVEERLSATLYGIEPTIKLIKSPGDVDFRTIIKPKTTADNDRLKTVESKAEFFDGLAKRLLRNKLEPVQPKVKEASSRSHVESRTTGKPRQEVSSPRVEAAQKAMAERSQQIREETIERREQQKLAMSNQSNGQLKEISKTLRESHSLHSQALDVLKQIKQGLSEQPRTTSTSSTPTQTQSQERPQAQVAKDDSYRKPQGSPFDNPKINLDRLG